ncbi:RCC1/BLIP-II, partial [Coccomyxa subellipsoidea C-169]
MEEESLSPELPRLRINKHIQVAKETEFAVSPSTPLLSTAIDENGWVCGRNHNGQLGVGGTADVQEPQVMQVVRRWAALSIGETHAAGVSGDNQTYTWGCNEHGQLGVAAGEPSDVPRKMNILRGWDVRAIACGAEHTVAITPDDVITWGSNSMGQCGQGDRAETDWVKPRSIKPLQSMFVCQIV